MTDTPFLVPNLGLTHQMHSATSTLAPFTLRMRLTIWLWLPLLVKQSTSTFERGRGIGRLDSCVASVIELAFSGCMGRRYLLKNKIENPTKLFQTRPEQLLVGLPGQNVHGLRAWKYRAPRRLRVKKPWSPFG